MSHIFQLVFLAGTVFFSHNKSNSTFNHGLSAKRMERNLSLFFTVAKATTKQRRSWQEHYG
jgi:hypothetical protein